MLRVAGSFSPSLKLAGVLSSSGGAGGVGGKPELA